MMMIINVLTCLIILTSQCVHSKVINVNNDDGNDSTECCVHGRCACSSLYTALRNIASYTIINITSKSVALHDTTTIGSGKLTNITITGSNVTIMCNDSGSVYCESCDNVSIEGITWDRCGDPKGTNIAGVAFNGTSNITLVNCTFQHSLITAVALLEVSDNILIQICNFSSNIPINDYEFNTLNISRYSPGSSNSSNITITIFGSCFYNNGYLQNITGHSSLNIDIDEISVINCYIILKKTTFISNRMEVNIAIRIDKLVHIQLIEILAFNNSFLEGIRLSLIPVIGDVVLSIVSSHFKANYGIDMSCFTVANITSITINNSNFTDGRPSFTSGAVSIQSFTDKLEITFYGVWFSNYVISGSASDIYETGGRAVYIYVVYGDVEINMHTVNFISNQYLYIGGDGGALYILLANTYSNCSIFVKDCEFVDNNSLGHGAALYIYTDYSNKCYLQIADIMFDHNIAGNSVVYIAQDGFSLDNNIQVQLSTSSFTNNIASSLYLLACDITLSGVLFFENNTAENGAAMYLDQGTTVAVHNEATVQFISNTATLNGGAIYVDFLCGNIIDGDAANTFLYNNTMNFMFTNNSATIGAGNSLYFNLPRLCSVNTNTTDPDSILYVPCQFNYSQPINGEMIQHIPCDLNYTLLNGTGAPIVTSPHELRLYFPYNEGYNISSASKPNTYYIKNNILGQEVKFTGAVFDYFGKPTEPTLFNMHLQCSNSTECSTYTLIGGNRDHILTQSIDNYTILNVKLKGNKIDVEHIERTVILTSLSYSLNKVNATLVIELIPCVNYPGYTYSEDSQTCVCYHVNVKCSNDSNEIKRGYWFGNITGKATTSLCPNHYCKFKDRKQTSEGYFELPNTIDAQCNHRRVGRACGKCKSGYTLSYDSTDCISTDQCGPGWTILVIVLTCLYWIAMVACVFICFKFQISLGHLYGIIYYYSIVGILLANNPYVSDGAFQFVSILSSLAQLAPHFLGKLCFVTGLSGIDQLFIHYSHAVAVSLLLLLIVVAARCSARITFYVRHRIIRVICLLILLSYTSIASTSLELLLPLRFTDVQQWYTYSSPHIKYFHHQHAVYGVVAVICELVIVVGLSLLLLLEPVLSRKINFIRIKPLLDQFQGCFKDKYRWFAAYYLICRQVIFLIVYIFNSNYYNMLFYLQTACIVIALIHIWFQPYRDELLNALDSVMLLIMVLIVNINTFPFLHEVTTEISLILVMLPLFLYCTIAIKKTAHTCFGKKYSLGRSHTRQYNQIHNVDNGDDENAGVHMAVR